MWKYLLLAIVVAPVTAVTSSLTAAIGQIFLEGRANEVITVSWMSEGGELLAIPLFCWSALFAAFFLAAYGYSLHQVVMSSILQLRKGLTS